MRTKYALTLYNSTISCERLQKRLFNYGYKWSSDGREILSNTRGKNHLVIYSDSKNILWGCYANTYPSYEEILPEAFLKLLEEGKIKI